MSVIAVTLHWNGATGLAKSGDEREFTAVYRAVTNDARDGPQVIIDHFRDSPNLPFLDYSYAYGNDVQVNAFCDRIDPRRVDGSNVVWEVSLHYAPAEGDESSEPTEGFDKDGNRTTDPLAFHDEIAISKAQFTIPVYRAKIWGGLRGRALIRRPVGTEEVPRNSAGVVFDPPLEMDHSRTVLRLTKRMASFPMEQSEEYQDAINSDWFQIARNIPSFSATFSQYQLKMQNIGGSFQRQNGVFFWRVDYEMHIDRRFGWRVDVPDRGLAARADIGDPDGRGGQIYQAPPAGAPKLRRLVDAAGNPLSEPVLLDGDGQPLDPPDGEPVYLTYGVYQEKPFADFFL